MDTFVRLVVQGILSILHQTYISKTSILLVSSVFVVHVSATYINTEKTSDRISLFLVPLEIFLLHVRFCSLVIAASVGRAAREQEQKSKKPAIFEITKCEQECVLQLFGNRNRNENGNGQQIHEREEPKNANKEQE